MEDLRKTRKHYEVRVRGTIIIISISFESALVSILYASNIKQYEKPYSKNLDIIKLPFGNKLKIIKAVLKEFHPDLLTKYKELFKDLAIYASFRNLMAHYPFEWSETNIEEFVVWSNTIDKDGFRHPYPIPYNTKKVFETNEEYSKRITPKLVELRTEVEQRLKKNHPHIYEIITRAAKP